MTIDTLETIHDVLLSEVKKAEKAREKSFSLLCRAEEQGKETETYEKLHEKMRRNHNRLCRALREFQEVEWK